MIKRSFRLGGREDSESYFISMTDMMVGLVFIFVILLAYYAITFQVKSQQFEGSARARSEILTALQQEIESELKTKIYISEETGILRLPERILFKRGQSTLTSDGENSVAVVANAMAKVLPCYTEGAECLGRAKSDYRVDAIFVEGHADAAPFTNGLGFDNYNLSLQRAVTTFRRLKASNPKLDELRNLPETQAGSARILSLSGYGPDRLIPNTDPYADVNRRIDLRFIMISGSIDQDALLR